METLHNHAIHKDGKAPSGILGAIENKRVVAFRIGENKKEILIEECCDGFFAVILSLKEFDEMLAELAVLRTAIAQQ